MRTRAVRSISLIGLLAIAIASAGGGASSQAATSATAYDIVRIDAPDPQPGGRWGERVADAGDVSRDGTHDFYVATPMHDVAGTTDAGRVYLVNGADFSIMRVIESPEIQANAKFGFFIQVFGDVTGDGRPEIAIGTDAQDVYTGSGTPCGQPEPNGCNEDQGRAWVFSGATGAQLYALNNPAPQGKTGNSARFGSRIGTAGDINADGASDLFVGASNNDVPAGCGDTAPPPAGCKVNQGQAFIFNGKSGALLRPLDLPAADQRPGTCSAGCGTFGLTVQSPGDVDNDGVDDQLVDAGSFNYDTLSPANNCDPSPICNVAQGRLYVFSGASGNLIRRIDAPEPQFSATAGNGLTFGFMDAEPFAPGDVNGDGYDDVFGDGWQQDTVAGPAVGRAWVFSGKTGAILFQIDDPTPQPGGQFGWSLAKTDFNKDGVPDLYVGGSPHHVPQVDEPGGTSVSSGVNGSPLKVFDIPASDVQSGSPAGPRLGWGLASPGDLNRDGEPDYLGGAPFLDVAGTVDQGAVYAYMSHVPAQTPPPAPPPPPPPPPAPAPVVVQPAKMAVARATVYEMDRVLDVLAPISTLTSGKVSVDLEAAGSHTKFTTTIDSAKGRIKFRHPIPKSQAEMRTGILTLTYDGDPDTRPQTVRLRAAPEHADLDLERPTLVDGHLKASGTVSQEARGVVRVQIQYVNSGKTTTLQFATPIHSGRWSLDQILPATVLAEIAARTGTLHSYTLFTGYVSKRMRGEMRSFQVLGPR